MSRNIITCFSLNVLIIYNHNGKYCWVRTNWIEFIPLYMLVQQKDKDNEHLNIGHTIEFDSKTQNLEFLSYEKPDIEASRTVNRQLIIDMMEEVQGTPSIS